jgi:hypothetical protein
MRMTAPLKKVILLSFLVVGASLLLAGCGGPNPMVESGASGFFGGLWDGFSAPFAFIASLFGADYNIYEVKNNGNWYNFGYLIGISVIMGGTGGAAGSRA